MQSVLHHRHLMIPYRHGKFSEDLAWPDAAVYVTPELAELPVEHQAGMHVAQQVVRDVAYLQLLGDDVGCTHVVTDASVMTESTFSHRHPFVIPLQTTSTDRAAFFSQVLPRFSGDLEG